MVLPTNDLTAGKLVDLFKEQVKNYSSNIWDELLILEWMDEAQLDFARKTRMFQTIKYRQPTAVGNRVITAGKDVLSIDLVTWTDASQSNRVHVLTATTEEKLHEETDFPNETAGVPTHFYYDPWLVGEGAVAGSANSYINVYPKPNSASDTCAIRYGKRPTQLTGEDVQCDIPKQYHRLLVKGALYHCLWKDVKTEQADRFKDEYMQGLDSAMYEIKNQVRANRPFMRKFKKHHQKRSIARY